MKKKSQTKQNVILFFHNSIAYQNCMKYVAYVQNVIIIRKNIGNFI